VIVAFADQNVADSQDLEFLVSDAKIGMPQPCRILRREQGIELEVIPAEEPDMLEREWNRGPSWLGMSVASANGDDPRVARLREVFGVETDRGVMVLEVDDGGPAAAAGVQPGDVVLAIEDRPVENLEDYLSIRGDFGDDQTTVTLLIESGGEKSYLRLETKLESREG
jgi:S1-C subfamily serine protease